MRGKESTLELSFDREPNSRSQTSMVTPQFSSDPREGSWTPERATDAWNAWTPKELFEVIGESSVPWCVTAGWAIELFVGQPIRPHSDLEVAIPRTAV